MGEETRAHWSRAKSQQTQAINPNNAKAGIKSGTHSFALPETARFNS